MTFKLGQHQKAPDLLRKERGWRTEEERLKAVRQYLAGELNEKQIVEQYALSSVQLFYQWIGRYCQELIQVTTNSENLTDSNGDPALLVKEKDREIIRLRKALELEKMRSEGYLHMIELAEQQFNIPIRKKSGTKQ